MPFQLENVPEPEPGVGEVRMRIEAAGMCHTELHFESGLLNLGVAPLTMGHEIAGVIDRVGVEVPASRVGERVLVYYYVGCGACKWCGRGDENLCVDLQAEYGFLHDGGYTEYIAVPARNAVRLPDEVAFHDAAPIGCAVATAIHACNLAAVGEDDVVVVYGIGAVGYGLVQVARLGGARVVGIGRTPGKLELARDLGAHYTINATETDDVAAAVRAWTGGRGADIVFEQVATAATMGAATHMLAKRGKLVFIGYSEDSFTVHPIDLVISEAIVMGSVGNTLAELVEAVRLVAQEKVRTLVDRLLPLDRWSEGIEALRCGEIAGRVVLQP